MTENNNHKFLEVFQKIKDNSTGFKNEINEVVSDFTSVAIKYITDLQTHFKDQDRIYNDNLDKLKNEVKEQKNKNEFEEHNYNRVSFIKQQDKEINQAKLKIEELESKLRFAESEINKLKSKLQTTETINLDTLHIEINDDTIPINETASNETTSDDTNTSTSITTDFTQCLARIGRKRFKYESLSQDEKDKYPDNVFISKSGFVLGKSCPVMIEKENTFCDDHSDKFENITLKPHREKRKTKSKSKTSSEDETVEEPVEEVQEEPVEEVQEEPVEEVQEEPPIIEIKEPPTFDDIEMYESDSGTCYYEDIRDNYKGYLYEITEDEEIGAFIKVKIND